MEDRRLRLATTLESKASTGSVFSSRRKVAHAAVETERLVRNDRLKGANLAGFAFFVELW